QGEEGDTFYILYDGQVAVEVNGKEVSRLVGDPAKSMANWFGERALLQEEPRAATIRCLSKKVVALALDRELFLAVVQPEKKDATVPRGDMVEYRQDKLDRLGLLGCGGFGIVTLVKCKVTGNVFALKALSKGHVLQQKLELGIMSEKTIMRMTHSPFLVRLAATFNGSPPFPSPP
ncbi:unnamed protein product, partial [Polarella glacialis]